MSATPRVCGCGRTRVQTQLKPVCDDGGEVNSSEEIASELVVSSSDAPEVFEAAEASFNDVSALVSSLVEGVDDDAVGFVGNDRLCAEVDDLSAQLVAVIAFIAKESLHSGGKRQHVGRSGDVSILAGGEMKDDGPAARIAQAMDFGRASAARAADGLILLPPFPPEAQR